ncbi:MAG: hypothetical protein K9M55_05800 [Candidatus Marinimicrobia bacterium]|nr:hypothetical protein [Candidatus Neomarinimicrobiota bacterium]MCF7922197.1 hypothetical protein [Candidatus Neomarinimicrobiota bacterium]
MINTKRSRFDISTLILSLTLLTSMAFGQYTVGQTIDQSTRDKIVSFCANDAGNISLGDLLVPEQGSSNRVLWLNFFESW